tara:strand:- start:444 stop:581 length:138 start_codon:yes stop_codon:yes gene_type:complete
LVERVIRNDEVAGSIPAIGTRFIFLEFFMPVASRTTSATMPNGAV